MEEKSNKKLIIIIIISVLVVIGGIVAAILLLTKDDNESKSGKNGGGSSSSSSTNKGGSKNSSGNGNNGNGTTKVPKKEISKKEAKNQIAKLSSKVECHSRNSYEFEGNCILYVTNNNDTTVNVVVSDLQLLDANGKQVGGSASGHPYYSNGLGAGETGIIPIQAYISDDFKTFKASFDLQTWFISEDHRHDIGITEKNDTTSKKIKITGKNNSNATVGTIAVYVTYYKDGKIIGIQRANLDKKEDGTYYESDSHGYIYIKPGNIAIGEADYPKDEHYKPITDFDKYEVTINEAYVRVKSFK